MVMKCTGFLNVAAVAGELHNLADIVEREMRRVGSSEVHAGMSEADSGRDRFGRLPSNEHQNCHR